jgi:hypothetical protein
MVPEAHRRLDLVHVLPALAAGAHRRDLDVLGLHLDVDLVVHVRGDIDGGEGRLPRVIGVEGAHAHEAVHAVLGAQVAVGRGAGDGDGHVVDAGLVALLVVDDLGLVAASLAEAQVHAHEHRRPVLGVGAARAGLDAQDGVAAIGRAGEHAIELGLAELLIDARDLRLGVGDDRLVIFGGAELEVLGRVLDLPTELVRHLQLGFDGRALAQDALGLVVVVPEPWGQGHLGEIFELSLEPRDVKDAPLAPQSAF